MEAKNILLITLDCFRQDRLGCYEASSDLTPNIDRVARNGLVFRNAFTVANHTDPSHATMLTGVYPNTHGVLGQALPLQTAFPTISEVLAAEGWMTMGAVAVEHLSSYFLFDRGFSSYSNSSAWDFVFARTKNVRFRGRALLPLLRKKLPIPNTHWRDGHDVNRYALRWLSQHRKRPFFGWLHYFDAHDYGAGRDHDGENEVRYDDKVRYVDRLVGDIVDRLRQLEIAEETVLILLADHGETLGEEAFLPRSDARKRVQFGHGRTLKNRELQIPLIIAPAAGDGLGPTYVDGLVSTLDLFPTMLDLVGLSSVDRSALQGKSLLPLQTNPTDGTTDQIFAIALQELVQQRCVITPRYKLIHNYDTKTSELYDWRHDPEERIDLSAQRSELATSLKLALDHWWTHGETTYEREESEAISEMLRSLGYLD